MTMESTEIDVDFLAPYTDMEMVFVNERFTIFEMVGRFFCLFVSAAAITLHYVTFRGVCIVF